MLMLMMRLQGEMIELLSAEPCFIGDTYLPGASVSNPINFNNSHKFYNFKNDVFHSHFTRGYAELIH